MFFIKNDGRLKFYVFQCMKCHRIAFCKDGSTWGPPERHEHYSWLGLGVQGKNGKIFFVEANSRICYNHKKVKT